MNSTTEHTLEDRIVEYIAVSKPYFILIISVIGLFGNTLSVIVFSRQPNWRESGILYLFLIAITDTGILLCTFGVRGLRGQPFNLKYTHTLIPFICKLSLYLWYVFDILSCYILILFNIERLYAISCPLKAVSVITSARRKKALMILTSVSYTHLTLPTKA